MAKLYVKAFGFAFGIVAAALYLALGTLNMFFYLERGLNWAMAMAYLGYRPTLFSIIFNSSLCFAFAFCVGAVIALLYNRIIEESRQEIDEKIKMVARSIWESKGKPEATSADDWREAEKRVRGI
jgi:Protein of unknown function (DUF2934)